MTPRKGKQRQYQHQPTPLVQASDYESDAHLYNETHVPPTSRTNTELNLSVLRRYNPAIRSILSIAANAVIYLFSTAAQSWEKSGVEGTLFVCDQQSYTGEEGYCMVVLNRRGLDNIILDLSQTEDVEVTPELLIVRFQELGVEEQKVMGIWIHADKDDTREVNAGLIKQCWDALKSKAKQAEVPKESVEMGRKVSLRDLFGR